MTMCFLKEIMLKIRESRLLKIIALIQIQCEVFYVAQA